MQQVDLKWSYPCGIMRCNTGVYTNLIAFFFTMDTSVLLTKWIIKYLFLSRSVATDLAPGNFKIIQRCL